ncbi:Minor tail protein precursor H [Escherichia coli]|uniref:Minor tail protein H n=1 Tax=Escherichia coli TaxID=562 RepID=A0A2X3JF16_ECOLX|nr:Minor tail protein precursor H [Escherichia coli]
MPVCVVVNQFDAINQSVARFASASGVEVDKVAEAFGKLTTDPTSGLMAMARQFRNVTAEQIAYVAQLQRSGDEAGGLTGGERGRNERV